MKNHRGLFDFDDLIERTRELLRRSSPSWVLYKLDRGSITFYSTRRRIQARRNGRFASHRQRIRASDALRVASSRSATRSSRSSPFRARRRKNSTRCGAVSKVASTRQSSFRTRAPHSFLPLRADGPRQRRRNLQLWRRINRLGLSFDPAEPAPEHTAWKSNAPGLIEIWEPIGASKRERVEGLAAAARCCQPRRSRRDSRPQGRAQDRGAAGFKQWRMGQRRRIRPRAIAPGDFLILVRKRDAFFEAMIRALKERHIPVAGADRLDLMNRIAVMDLCALGRAALLPEDDLTLAIVLKSPPHWTGRQRSDRDRAPKREGALIHCAGAIEGGRAPGGGAAIEQLEPRRAAIDALRFLQPRARRRTGTRTARRAVGAGGERRHRRIS